MKIIITIGHQDILLPDETGVQQLLKLLGKGILVHERLYEGKVEVSPRELNIGMKTVPASTKFIKEPDPEGDCETEIEPFMKTRKSLNKPRLFLSA